MTFVVAAGPGVGFGILDPVAGLDILLQRLGRQQLTGEEGVDHVAGDRHRACRRIHRHIGRHPRQGRRRRLGAYRLHHQPGPGSDRIDRTHHRDPGQQSVHADAERSYADHPVRQLLDPLDIGPDLLDIRDGPSDHVAPLQASP